MAHRDETVVDHGLPIDPAGQGWSGELWITTQNRRAVTTGVRDHIMSAAPAQSTEAAAGTQQPRRRVSGGGQCCGRRVVHAESWESGSVGGLEPLPYAIALAGDLLLT